MTLKKLQRNNRFREQTGPQGFAFTDVIAVVALLSLAASLTLPAIHRSRYAARHQNRQFENVPSMPDLTISDEADAARLSDSRKQLTAFPVQVSPAMSPIMVSASRPENNLSKGFICDRRPECANEQQLRFLTNQQSECFLMVAEPTVRCGCSY